MANGPGSTRQNNGPFTVGGFYNFAPFTLVDGQACALQFDINGNLKVTSTGGGGGSNPAAGPTGAPVPTDADYLGINIAGTLFGVTGFNLPDSVPIAVAIVNANGDQITSFGGGTQYTDGTTQATPTGTVALGKNPSNVLHSLALDASGNLLVDVSNTNLSVTQGTTPWIVAGSGTAGTPSTAVLTVQGISAGTPIPISGTISVTQGTTPWIMGGQAPNAPVASTFAHVQGKSAFVAGGVSTLSVVLTSAPTLGNLVCVAVGAYTTGNTGGVVLVSVKDSNGNIYTISPSSPSNGLENEAGSCWLAYLLSAPSNATATITATFAATVQSDIVVWADEFSHTGSGLVTFDKDASAQGYFQRDTLNGPVIVPTYSNSLLYAVAIGSGSVSGVNAPWTVGLIDATTGWATEYDLSASSPTIVSVNFSAQAVWDSMAMVFYAASNPAVLSQDFIPLGPSGRSVIIEGVSGGIPIPVSFATPLGTNLVKVADSPVMVAATFASATTAIAQAGTQIVGLVGSSAAFLDTVITAATAPANGLMTLAVNRTTAPSLTTGQSVGLQCDYAGDLFVKPIRRSKTVAATGNIASATPANIIGSQGAGIFADLSAVVLTLREGATANVFFGVLISDGTNSYRFNFMSQSATTIQAASPIQINFDPPIPAASAATAWTIAVTSTTDSPSVDYICNFVLQKAS